MLSSAGKISFKGPEAGERVERIIYLELMGVVGSRDEETGPGPDGVGPGRVLF